MRWLVASLLVACSNGGDGSPVDAAVSIDAMVDLCEAGCVATLAAACANGPPTQEVCVADCRQLQTGRCAIPFAALQACAEGEAVTCNAMGLPTIIACATEQTALVTCLNGP